MGMKLNSDKANNLNKSFSYLKEQSVLRCQERNHSVLLITGPRHPDDNKVLVRAADLRYPLGYHIYLISETVPMFVLYSL